MFSKFSLKSTLKMVQVLAFSSFLFSCSQEYVEIKSPCVSAESGPCGNRVNPNEEFLKSIGYYS